MANGWYDSAFRVAWATCLALCVTACGGRAPTSVVAPPPEPSTTAEIRLLAREDRTPPLISPPACRQMHEGYWLGAMIDRSHVAWLSAAGIRVVVSAVEPSPETVAELQRWGIERVSVPMSNAFGHGERILEVVDTYRPDEIFIHCRHGADRTGAIAAFLLVVRHHWTIPDAFYSVIYKHESDVRGLADVLREYGLVDSRDLDDPSVGFYSVSAAGGVGGLKARNTRYAHLIETTLEAIQSYVMVSELTP